MATATGEHREKPVKNLAVILLFGCIVLVFFHDVLIGPNLLLDANPFYYDPWKQYAPEDGLRRKTYRTDSFTTYLPRRALLSESIAEGRLPLWNPYVFAGAPAFADPQTRALYPVELLLTQVDPMRAIGYDVAIHVLLAMTGMFLFLRAIRVTTLGAAIGGCSYAFSSFFYVRYGDPTLIASAAWVPFFFYGFELAKRSQRFGTLLLTVFLAMGCLAGFPQVLIFGVGALLIYGLWLSLDRPSADRRATLKQTVRIIGIAGALSMLLVSVQMIPFIEYFRESVGLHYEFDQLRTVYLAPPVLLLRSLFPGLFGNPVEGADWSDLPRETVHPYHPEFAVYCGIGVLVLAVISVRLIRQSPRLRIFVSLVLLSVGLAVSPYVLRAGYALLPVLRTAKISRISVVACFALTAMGGIGLTSISRNREVARKYLPRLLVCMIALVLVSSIVFELAGDSVIANLAEKARSIPEAQWEKVPGYTRSGRIREWAEGSQSEWVAYERRQLRRGVYFILLISGIMWLWHRLSAHGRKSTTLVGILLAGLMAFDIVSVAKTYYVSQSPGSVWETEGIGILKEALGTPGRWRTRTARRTLEEMLALPTNVNQVFGVHSLEGTSTMYPRSHADLKTVQTSTEAVIDSPLNRRQWLASDVDDLMCVRFLVAPSSQHRYVASSVLKSVTAVAESPSSVGMLGAGGEPRLALRQEPGDRLTFEVSFPPADTLAFAIGFEADAGQAGDSVFFNLECASDLDAVQHGQGFDLTGSGNWHSVALDVSKLKGRHGSMTVSIESNVADGRRSIVGGWSRFEFVFRRARLRPTARGYEIGLGSRGLALSLELRSEAREVPLTVTFDDGSVSRRWFSFPAGMRSRSIMIDLKGRARKGLMLESDSTFSVEHCCQVWRGWTQDLDCQLIYDGDMCIYENTAAADKGLCVDPARIDVTMAEGEPVLSLRSLKAVNDARCGECKITSYQPCGVVAEVSAAHDCYFLFQDMYYPGWQAHIDGRETRILKTDLGIRALEVPQGNHTITMAFRPRTLYAGLALTCVGLLLTVAYALKTCRRGPSAWSERDHRR
jgi:hypothetical protein